MDTVRGNLDLTAITALRDGLPLFNKTTNALEAVRATTCVSI